MKRWSNSCFSGFQLFILWFPLLCEYYFVVNTKLLVSVFCHKESFSGYLSSFYDAILWYGPKQSITSSFVVDPWEKEEALITWTQSIHTVTQWHCWPATAWCALLTQEPYIETIQCLYEKICPPQRKRNQKQSGENRYKMTNGKDAKYDA